MIVKEIEYTDYNGNVRKEELRFHLSDAEVFKWLHSTDGDYTLDAALEAMTKKGNGKEIVKAIEELILMSYGEISLDGKRFIKSKEMAEAFMQSEAYSKLFMELAFDADKAVAFVNGILPKDMGEKFKQVAAEQNAKGENNVVSIAPNA